jgi:hypothetical protein
MGWLILAVVLFYFGSPWWEALALLIAIFS